MDSCSQVAKSNFAGAFVFGRADEGTICGTGCRISEVGAGKDGLGDGVGFGFGGGEVEVEGVELCDGSGETDIAFCNFASLFNRIYEERIGSR